MSRSLQLQVLLRVVDQATRPFKAVQAASKALSGDIRTTQGSIKALEAQSAKIDGFRKASAQLAVTGQALKKAKENAAALAIQLRNTANPTAQQTRLMEGAKRAASDLQTKYNGLRQSVQRQRDTLNASGISTRNLSSEQRRLRSSAAEATAAFRHHVRHALYLVEGQVKGRLHIGHNVGRFGNIKTGGQRQIHCWRSGGQNGVSVITGTGQRVLGSCHVSWGKRG